MSGSVGLFVCTYVCRKERYSYDFRPSSQTPPRWTHVQSWDLQDSETLIEPSLSVSFSRYMQIEPGMLYPCSKEIPHLQKCYCREDLNCSIDFAWLMLQAIGQYPSRRRIHHWPDVTEWTVVVVVEVVVVRVHVTQSPNKLANKFVRPVKIKVAIAW